MIELIEDDILQMLMGTDRPLRTGKMAERLGVTKPTVVYHLNRLKEEGKVEPVLYRNIPSWQLSPKWSVVLQRAERLQRRLKEMYGDKPFSPAEARERLKWEFKREEFDAFLEIIPHIKPPVPELKVTRRIGCTREEEVQAKRESDASQIAARVFLKTRRTMRNLHLVARTLQRFNKRWNFWFLGDSSPDSAINLFPEKAAEPIVEEDLAVRAERLPRNLATKEIKAKFDRSIDSLRHRRSMEEMRRELERKMERLRREN